jgi:hypothetical protein
MRSLLTRVVVIALAVAGLSVLTDAAAHSDTKCARIDPLSGHCTVYVEVADQPSGPATPVDDVPKGTGSGAACYWDPAKQGLSSPPAGPVPCTSDNGFWSNSYNCYIKALDPQPAADDPIWQGHEPGVGAMYACYQPLTGMGTFIWAENPPPGSGVGPSPRQVAEIAIKQMSLSAIDIGIVPRPGPDSVGLVGMPVWMWAKNPSDHTYGPITASASAGGITISATAKVLRIAWDMGDGTRVVCDTAGTPYDPSYGRRSSPDCGHVYQRSSAHRPGESYTVTATSDWVVTWSGAGQTGSIRLAGLSRSTQITIGEAQVLVN